MIPFSLESGPPPEWRDSTSPIYLLGVGGPEDEDGIGKVERFVWRFSALLRQDALPVVFGFTSMPTLMRFTRAVNAQAPFTVPTEVFKVAPSELKGGAPVAWIIDPDPEAFHRLVQGKPVVERRIPELEGGH
jgi:hypothetical protein